MAEKFSPQYQYIGFRLNKNIYNRSEVLVIPGLTVLTRQDIDMLSQQKIMIDDEDVEHVSVLYLVDSAIQEFKEVFVKVRYSDQIPYDDVHKKVLPIIIEMTNHPELNKILTYFEQHDDYTYRHSIGVSLISRLIGRALGYNERELLELTKAGFLHDIGKAKIPEKIINKKGKLSPEEFNQVKKHTIYGFELMKQTSGISDRYALVALQHHEREDGSGYPHGMRGKDIDPFSKIVAVADVFHAMVSKRVYKNSVPFYKVLLEMSQNAFGSLEPTITFYFIKRIMDMMVGNHIVLSNGYEGKIIMINPTDPINPLVEVNGWHIDLSKEPDIYMDRIV